jgi:hypothetical protein
MFLDGKDVYLSYFPKSIFIYWLIIEGNMEKATRSSKEKSTTFKGKWEKGMKVYCRIPNISPVQWETGTIRSVSECIGAKRIIISLHDSNKDVTITDSFSEYIREVDPIVLFLQDQGPQLFVYKMFKNLLSQEEKAELIKEYKEIEDNNFDFMELLDRISYSYKADLNDDECCKNTVKPATSVIYSLKRLLDKDEYAREIINKATDGKAKISDPFIVLAFIVARIIGIELQYELIRGMFLYPLAISFNELHSTFIIY